MQTWEQVRKRLDQNAPLFGSAALSAGMIFAGGDAVCASGTSSAI